MQENFSETTLDAMNDSVGDVCVDCPDACGSKAFAIEMSFATLSSLSAQKLLSYKNQSVKMEENFKVNPSFFT